MFSAVSVVAVMDMTTLTQDVRETTELISKRML